MMADDDSIFGNLPSPLAPYSPGQLSQGAPDQFGVANPNATPAWPTYGMPQPNQFAAPPGGFVPNPNVSPQDRDAAIRTIIGEAGGEPALGQAGIAHVLNNRMLSGQYGNGSISSVAQQPVKPGSQYHEFSVWNAPGVAESSKATHTVSPDSPRYQQVGRIFDGVMSGAIPDPTGGATHYYAPRAMKGGIPPPWAGPLAKANDVTIANTRFVGSGPSGPGSRPIGALASVQ